MIHPLILRDPVVTPAILRLLTQTTRLTRRSILPSPIPLKTPTLLIPVARIPLAMGARQSVTPPTLPQPQLLRPLLRIRLIRPIRPLQPILRHRPIRPLRPLLLRTLSRTLNSLLPRRRPHNVFALRHRPHLATRPGRMCLALKKKRATPNVSKLPAVVRFPLIATHRANRLVIQNARSKMGSAKNAAKVVRG